MDEIKIEKDIQPKEKRGGRRYKYPWQKMEVGDTFSVKCKGAKFMDALQRSVITCSKVYSKYNPGAKFKTWRDEEDGKEVIKVKRIA